MKKLLYFSLLSLLAAFVVSACSGKGTGAEKVDTTPRLISIAPHTFYSGGTAIISGYWFSENILDNLVLIDGERAQVNAASKNRLTVTLPDHADGEVEVKVSVAGVQSPDRLTFTYAPLPPSTEPVISGISPASGMEGTSVTITGENFSAVAAQNSVRFGDLPAVITSASATQLVVTAPACDEGPVTVIVSVEGKKAALPNGFTYEDINDLSITSIYPTSGEIGDLVRITGTGFSTTLANNRVTLSGAAVEIKEVTENTIDVYVPDQDGGTYQFTVKVRSHTAVSEDFTINKSWRVNTVAGTGTAGCANGTGTKATVNRPQDCVLDANGDLWFTQWGVYGLRKMNPRTYAVTTAKLKDENMSYPWAVAAASDGKIWFTNKGAANANASVCYWDGENIVRVEGLDESVQTTKNAMGIEFGTDGTAYVLCRANPSIIYLYKNGSVQGDIRLSGSIEHMTVNPARTHLFLGCSGGGNYFLKMLNLSTQEWTTIAGTGAIPTAETFTDGTPGNPLSATIGLTEGMCVAEDGTLYFTDATSYTLRTLTPAAGGDYASGTVRTLAGTPFVNVHADGAAKTAGLVDPRGVVELSDHSLILLDGLGHRIKRVYLK